jgi:hypothetical protein
LLQGIGAAGHRVTALTPHPDSLPAGLAAVSVEADFSDAEQCIEKAMRIARERHLDGVICYQQAATNTTNLIAHALGLAPIWDDPSIDLTNKRDLYDLWLAHKVAHPKALTVTGPDDPRLSGLTFPVVVKPASMMGGLGVRKCDSPLEASDWISFIGRTEAWVSSGSRVAELYFGYSPDQKQEILVQEYVEPDAIGDRRPEFTAECAVADGKARVLDVFEKYHTEPPFFDESLFLLPAPDLDQSRLPRIQEAVAAAVRALGFHSGLCHAEFCFKDDEIVFYELNPRLIGEPGGRILSGVCGLDLPALLADLACGMTFLPEVLRQGYGGFVDIRAGRELEGFAFSGIDHLDAPRGSYNLDLARPVGAVIAMPGVRGRQVLARVSFLCQSVEEQMENAEYWQSPERILSSRAP